MSLYDEFDVIWSGREPLLPDRPSKVDTTAAISSFDLDEEERPLTFGSRPGLYCGADLKGITNKFYECSMCKGYHRTRYQGHCYRKDKRFELEDLPDFSIVYTLEYIHGAKRG